MPRDGKSPEKETMSEKILKKRSIGKSESQNAGDNIMSRRQFIMFSGASAALALGVLPEAHGQNASATKVGFIVSERGPYSAEAKSLMAGFEYYFKQAGVVTPPVTVVKKDPGPNDEKALECLTELMSDTDVRFLVGPLSLKGSEQVILGASAANATLFVTNPCIRLVAGEMCLQTSFRISANTYQCGWPLGAWSVKNLGTKAFITGADDNVGNEIADFFAFGFERAGGSFVDRVMSEPAGIKKVLTTISKSDANVVFAAFKGEAAATFVREFRKVTPALKQQVIGPESLTGFPQPLASLKNVPVNAKTLSCLKNPAELVNDIKKKARIDAAHAVRAAEGYDLAAIISKCVGASSDELKDLGKRAKFIEEMEIQGPRGKMSFDKNHEPILDMVVQEWELSGSGHRQKILENLGPCRTPDFGCGRIGFPRRPDADIRDEESFLDQNE
jgi:branched-chain amino acid transport system substrate-binding protein